jgi:ACS family glucarate transporter-like MFS transporter
MPRKRYIVYTMIFMFNLVAYIDRINMSVAAVSIAEDLKLTAVSLGWLFSSFLVTYIAMLLPIGYLLDKIGVKWMATLGALVWSISQVLTGAVGSFFPLLLTRLGLGVGEATYGPVTYKSVREWGPASEHGAAIGFTQSASLLGPAIGAPFVAWVTASTSWRWSFVITGAIGLLWVLIWLLLRISTPEKTKWVSEAEREKITRERYEDNPVVASQGVGYLGLIRSPSLWGLAINQGCAVYSLYLYLSWFPNYLSVQRHVSLIESGWLTAAPFFVGAILVLVVNWIGDRTLSTDGRRKGRRRFVVIVSLLMTAGGMAIPYAEPLWLVIVLATLPIGFAGAVSPANAALTSDLLRSPADAGKAFAFIVLGANLFGIMAPIVTGYIVAYTGSFNSAFMLAGCISIVGAACAYFSTRYALGSLPFKNVDPLVGGQVRHAS